ncbi:F-box/kelch-repeat protein At3g06240-like [Rutidosis leptorrhynchoides]|uniref:F-box/kelch-repeat protein At3g06240-like n=1 Tax=Rutidosis leptorrhynchoides TaxID=125765 RepID=UPI003A99CCF9
MSDPQHNSICALNLLPQDLIEAILPFLPPKSLGRFKSVSKPWYSLISSPKFIKTHIHNYTKNNPNPNPSHMILDLGDSIYSIDIKQLNIQPTPATLTAKRLNFQEPLYDILGSCNGLLLAKDINHNLCFVNPATKNIIKVQGGFSIDQIYRFGYDSSTDDYKVISISRLGVSDSDIYTKFVRVYSLRNDLWNMLPNFSYEHDYLGPGVLLNHNLHWLISSIRSTMTIACCSLASEEIHEIELPNYVYHVEGMYTQLFALGGKLAAIFCVGLHVNELWVMEEYVVSNSWTKLCIIDNNMDQCYEFFAQVSNRYILLGSNESNEIVMNDEEDEIYIYDMDERRCTSVRVEGCPDEFVVCGTYAESLESPERFR